MGILTQSLGEALGFEPAFFSQLVADEYKPEECHFRRRATTPVAAISQVLAHGTFFGEAMRLLDRTVRFPKQESSTDIGDHTRGD